ncbi:MAG TPA: hypothetical protein EYH06_01790 [Chromatiales bacterium]|nr:hypothetical protein [Thiotrichales bacterium]HIP67307.1 hypothetical protein [Chromatiales bacterium]
MSGLIALIYLLIPVVTLLYARRRWKEAVTTKEKRWIIVIFGLIFLFYFWLAIGKKWYYDLQVNRLCAKDGGIKVYETVTLPPERFDKWGNVKIKSKRFMSPEDQYYLDSEEHFYRKHNPSFSKSRDWYVRKSDEKVLGEIIIYSRGGGDLYGPWFGTGFRCPPGVNEGGPNLESSIFLKGAQE